MKTKQGAVVNTYIIVCFLACFVLYMFLNSFPKSVVGHFCSCDFSNTLRILLILFVSFEAGLL